jgi:hypothetical protein
MNTEIGGECVRQATMLQRTHSPPIWETSHKNQQNHAYQRVYIGKDRFQTLTKGISMNLKLKKTVIWVVVTALLISALALPAMRLTARASAPRQADEPAGPQAVQAMPAPLASFEGLRRDQADAAFGPDSIKPDTSGDVGITRYIQAVNTSVAIFNKVGGVIASSTFGAFWTGAATTTACDTDVYHHGQPTVLYDHMAQRWVVMDVAYDTANINTGPYYYCIAVSNSAAVEAVDQFIGEIPDPLNPPDGDWWFYTLRVDNYLPSQPRMALWPDGYYVGADMLDIENNGLTRNPRGVRVWAFNRDDLVNGLTPFHSQTHYLFEAANYTHLVPANLNGNPPPTGTPGIFASIQPPNKFLLWKFEVDWINNIYTFNATPTTLYMDSPYAQEVGFVVDQAGTTEKLDVLGDQLTTLEYREVNGSPALWAAHTAWLNADQRTLRWYEIRNPSTSPAFYQQGSYDPDQHSRWISSLGVDVEGNMAIGYSVSSSAMYPAIRYAGRLVNDPLNSLAQGEATLYAGTTFQDDVNGINDGFWGTRSAMSSDPVDECVFWYANEYYSAAEPLNPNRNWHTRIGWFRFPSCGSGSLLRVSLSSANAQGNGSSGMEYESYSSSISADGRFVVFASEATNLVNGDTNNQWDVFLRDRDVDGDGIFDEASQVATSRISVGPGGIQANGKSWEVSISGDGRFIAYSSDANNLVTGDTNGARDVFLYNRATGATTRVSVSSSGAQGNARSDQPSVSYDGHFVAFRSYATNLVANDTNDPSDIFVRDTWASLTTRVSVGPGGVQANAGSTNPAISGNGRYVAFASYATNLVGADANGNLLDVFVYDRNLGLTELISAVDLTAATYGNLESYTPAINYDGGFVVFVSRATNLVVPPTTGPAHVYLRNRALLRTKLVSTSYVGAQSNQDSYTPSISGDGRYIVYASDASNLDLTPDNNGVRDIFLNDREIGLTQRISRSVTGDFPNGRSHAPVISSNGRHIAFTSEATNLVSDDSNNKWDVFAYDRQATTVTFLAAGSNVPGYPGQAVYVPIRFTSYGQQIDTTTFSVDFDQTCLNFSTSPADAVVFSVPGGFTASYTFNGGDTDGELDFSIYASGTPLPALVDGVIATIRFTVSGACQAPPGASRSARVGFSGDPPGSFASSGSSVRGRVSDGSVTVLAGLLGDCNGDTARDAGDISAEVLEIFDGDGAAPADTPLGSFVGNPVGCNPNQDSVVDAGDISCLIILIFGGGSCGGAAQSSLVEPVETKPIETYYSGLDKLDQRGLVQSNEMAAADPLIAMPAVTTVQWGHPVQIPIRYQAGSTGVNALTFSLDYDPAVLRFDPTSPNTVTLGLPPGFTATVLYTPQDANDELDIAIIGSGNLTTSTLMTFTFQVTTTQTIKETMVDFTTVSFGGGGKSIPGSHQNGLIHLGPWEVYLPVLLKP